MANIGDNYTFNAGQVTSFIVPDKVKEFSIRIKGSSGASTDVEGGRGAEIHGILEVTPGETLDITVSNGQYPDGGNRGDSGYHSAYDGGHGGGSSKVERLGTVLVQAAGGGGAGGKSMSDTSSNYSRGGQANPGDVLSAYGVGRDGADQDNNTIPDAAGASSNYGGGTGYNGTSSKGGSGADPYPDSHWCGGGGGGGGYGLCGGGGGAVQTSSKPQCSGGGGASGLSYAGGLKQVDYIGNNSQLIGEVYLEVAAIITTVKIGTAMFGDTVLPIYDPTKDMDNKNQLRINTPKGIGCFELVDLNDVLATPLRVSTSNGMKSIAKE